MSEHNRIQYLNAIKNYLDFAVSKIEATGEFATVQRFESTSYADLFALYPQKELPLALVVYSGSTYAEKPRRTSEIAVIVIVRNSVSVIDGEYLAIKKVEKIIEALDWETFDHVVFKVTSDRPFDLEEQGISVFDIRFEVLDF